MRDPRALLDAAKVPPEVQSGRFGPWRIHRQLVEHPDDLERVGRSELTVLERTDSAAALHFDRGEIVMEDSDRELKRHLPIFMMAHGRVLKTGLGLGCVVRGLLAIPEVEHIDVVEIDPYIVAWVGAHFAGNPRVTIHHADALTWDPGDRTWDFAWHDIWCEGNNGLDVLHMKMIAALVDKTERQGAWAMPREITRKMPDFYIGGPRKRAS